MTVAEYIAKFLKNRHIEYIFGYEGSAMLKILDEIMATGSISYIQNFHEQASSFSADAFARISGTMGVALSTSGPGAINMLGGIADAYFDSIPVLFISGQDYSDHLIKNTKYRQNGFQDIDIANIVNKITKYSVFIERPQDIAFCLEKAVYIAENGRKGPVLLDIPIDVQFATVDEKNLHHFETLPILDYETKYDQVMHKLQSAKKPLLLVGGGIQLSQGCQEIDILRSKLNIPVVTTLNGLDSVNDAYGFSGLYGHTYANIALYNSDLILAIGTRFGQQQVGKNKKIYTNAAIIHIDIDRNELGRVIPESFNICSDIKVWLQGFNQKIHSTNFPNYTAWNDTLNTLKKREYNCVEVNHMGLDPVCFIRTVSRRAPDNSIFIGDVGQNQMWLAQGICKKNNTRIISSSGYGTMGFSLPAAIGARYADKDATIFAFSGDGGFQMNIQELQLLKIRQLDIKLIIFNNNNLGMMRETQKRYYNDHFYGNNPSEFSCVDLKAIAEAYSLQYIKIEKNDDIKKLLDVLEDKRPYVVECVVQKDSVLINRYDEYNRIGNIIL